MSYLLSKDVAFNLRDYKSYLVEGGVRFYQELAFDADRIVSASVVPYRSEYFTVVDFKYDPTDPTIYQRGLYFWKVEFGLQAEILISEKMGPISDVISPSVRVEGFFYYRETPTASSFNQDLLDNCFVRATCVAICE